LKARVLPDESCGVDLSTLEERNIVSGFNRRDELESGLLVLTLEAGLLITTFGAGLVVLRGVITVLGFC